MANYMTPIHTPAVNHETQRVSGYAVQTSQTSTHFVSDAVAHGNEKTSATLRTADITAQDATTLAGAGGPSTWTSQQISAIQAAVQAGVAGVTGGETVNQIQTSTEAALERTKLFSTAQVVAIGQAEEWDPHGASFVEKGKNTAPFYQAAYNSIMNGEYGSLTTSTTTADATTTASGTAAAPTPFTTLANLLSSLATTGAPIAAAVPDNSPGTSVPTQSGPSMVIPLMLILLAVGVGYFWYSQHHKKKAAA